MPYSMTRARAYADCVGKLQVSLGLPHDKISVKGHSDTGRGVDLTPGQSNSLPIWPVSVSI